MDQEAHNNLEILTKKAFVIKKVNKKQVLLTSQQICRLLWFQNIFITKRYNTWLFYSQLPNQTNSRYIKKILDNYDFNGF